MMILKDKLLLSCMSSVLTIISLSQSRLSCAQIIGAFVSRQPLITAIRLEEVLIGTC